MTYMYIVHVYTYLRSSHQVHLEEACLECSLPWSVVLESIKQEGGTLLHHVHLHEHVYNLWTTTKQNQKLKPTKKSAHMLIYKNTA